MSSINSVVLDTLIDGLAFPECPRWRNGRLWLSDQHGGYIYCLTEDGVLQGKHHVPGGPSGLGWTQDGELLAVSMTTNQLLHFSATGDQTVFANLEAVHPGESNDMVISRAGIAYVGNIGFDFSNGEEVRSTNIAMVTKSGVVTVAATDLITPNGSVILPDQETLVVAESLANRLTSFTIGEDGSLSNREVWAELGAHVPDGICLDAEGMIWIASPYAQELLRIQKGGRVVEKIKIHEGAPYACELGGRDGTTLFVCIAPSHDKDVTRALLAGRVDCCVVNTPRANST